jgi:hypothetical protein
MHVTLCIAVLRAHVYMRLFVSTLDQVAHLHNFSRHPAQLSKHHRTGSGKGESHASGSYAKDGHLGEAATSQITMRE